MNEICTNIDYYLWWLLNFFSQYPLFSSLIARTFRIGFRFNWLRSSVYHMKHIQLGRIATIYYKEPIEFNGMADKTYQTITKLFIATNCLLHLRNASAFTQIFLVNLSVNFAKLKWIFNLGTSRKYMVVSGFRTFLKTAYPHFGH